MWLLAVLFVLNGAIEWRVEIMPDGFSCHAAREAAIAETAHVIDAQCYPVSRTWGLGAS